MPALRTALFHGAIRTAHAVRAIAAVDTPPRRRELARALGYWPARYRAGQPAGRQAPADDPRAAVVRAAADGARRYLARPTIVHLHGVTGAMAVEILIGHLPATEATAAWPRCMPNTRRCTRASHRWWRPARPARPAVS